MNVERGDLVFAEPMGLVFVVAVMDGLIGGLRIADHQPVHVYPEQVLAVYRRAA